MKTLITTFGIALMVLALNTSPASAKGFVTDTTRDTSKCTKNPDGSIISCPQVADVKDPDESDNERDVADSGDEGSTSAASTSDH